MSVYASFLFYKLFSNCPKKHFHAHKKPVTYDFCIYLFGKSNYFSKYFACSHFFSYVPGHENHATEYKVKQAFRSYKLCKYSGNKTFNPFTCYDWTLAPCGFLRLSAFLSDALNYFLPIPSHSMWKDRASWKLSKCVSTFSVNWSRVTWCVFIFDEQIA